MSARGLPTVAEALKIARGLIVPSAPEWLPLEQLAGRRLAEAVRTRTPQPPSSVAAMDGWALSADATPGVVSVVGESAAGLPYRQPLLRGQAVRISTGAVIPTSADAVIRCEDADERNGLLTAPCVAAGADVRQVGEDYSLADVVLEAGQRVHAHDVGVIAACGWDGAFCDRRARVAVVSIGDELVPVDRVRDDGEIVDSNRVAIAAAVEAAGAQVAWTRWIPDDHEALAKLIVDAAQPGPGGAALIVTTGGASVGDHDVVRPVLRSLGADMVLEGIAMRPGRPTALALIGSSRVLVLPGTPSASMIGFHVIGRELLSAAEWTLGVVADDYASPAEVDEFVRCRSTVRGLLRLDARGSASLAGVAGADALVWIGSGRSEVCAGASVLTSPLP